MATQPLGQSTGGRQTNWLGRIVSAFGMHAVLIVFTVIVVYPVAWMFMSSLKTQSEMMSNIWGLPSSPAWQNYRDAWETAKLGRALFNSIFVSLSTVVLVMAIASTAGYALARFSFRFSLTIFLIFVLTMQAPVPVIPLYVMLVKLHMTDSYLGYILPLASGGLPLAIFIFRAFFTTIPRDLEDAALLDGDSRFGTFVRIIMPLTAPAVGTVAILQFLASWNEYFLALILIRSPELRTVPLAIQVFFFEFGRAEWGQIFAALTTATVPMIIVYVLMQRRFIQGLTAGAIKG
jgi:raffinose/stachyose/melibiose transport system permease protein